MMMMWPIFHMIVGVVVHLIGTVVGKPDVADDVVVVGGGIGGIGGIGIGGRKTGTGNGNGGMLG